MFLLLFFLFHDLKFGIRLAFVLVLVRKSSSFGCFHVRDIIIYPKDSFVVIITKFTCS